VKKLPTATVFQNLSGMNKASDHFSIHDFFWKDREDKGVAEAVLILNSLTKEQADAVEMLKSSAYREAEWEYQEHQY
jgi:hypothetical protein